MRGAAVARAPLLHFFVLGALLHLVSASWPAPPGTIVIDAARIDTLRREWSARTGSAPDTRELEALVRDAVDEELLFRRALALGLHETDALVQRRLIRNMRFVESGDSEERSRERSDSELLRAAEAMRMYESDLVVRRRLVQRMRLGVEDEARRSEPTEHELRAYLEEHAARFAVPAAARLHQIFLRHDPSARAELSGELSADAALAERARRLRAQLADAGVGPESAAGFGDPLPLPTAVPLRSESEIARTFGPEFARGVFALELGQWQGPVRSSYGVHLVWLHEVRPARDATLAEVRARVHAALVAERAERLLRARLDEMRVRVTVRVESRAGVVGESL